MKTKLWITTGLLATGLLSLGLVDYAKWSGTGTNGSIRNAEQGQASLASEREGFSFSADKGGKLFRELLPPLDQIKAQPVGQISEPLRLPGLAERQRPEAPMPALQPDLPRALPAPLSRSVRPRLLPPEPPLCRSLTDPQMPESLALATGSGVRLPSVPVDVPIPLPILAQPQVDRAALDDPTAEFSSIRVLSAKLPDRKTPAPFLHLMLPDPFEHRSAGGLKTLPPVVDQVPVTAAPLPGR
jgi:hypothetical protein